MNFLEFRCITGLAFNAVFLRFVF